MSKHVPIRVGERVLLPAEAARRLGIPEAAIFGLSTPAHTAPEPKRSRKGPVPMKIRIRDMQFDSAPEAARFFGITPKTVLRMVRLGREDFIGLGRGKSQRGAQNHKAVQVQIGQLHFATISDAAEALNYSHQALSVMLRRGKFSAKAMERADILARKKQHLATLANSLQAASANDGGAANGPDPIRGGG